MLIKAAQWNIEKLTDQVHGITNRITLHLILHFVKIKVITRNVWCISPCFSTFHWYEQSFRCDLFYVLQQIQGGPWSRQRWPESSRQQWKWSARRKTHSKLYRRRRTKCRCWPKFWHISRAGVVILRRGPTLGLKCWSHALSVRYVVQQCSHSHWSLADPTSWHHPSSMWRRLVRPTGPWGWRFGRPSPRTWKASRTTSAGDTCLSSSGSATLSAHCLWEKKLGDRSATGWVVSPVELSDSTSNIMDVFLMGSLYNMMKKYIANRKT